MYGPGIKMIFHKGTSMFVDLFKKSVSHCEGHGVRKDAGLPEVVMCALYVQWVK